MENNVSHAVNSRPSQFRMAALDFGRQLLRCFTDYAQPKGCEIQLIIVCGELFVVAAFQATVDVADEPNDQSEMIDVCFCIGLHWKTGTRSVSTRFFILARKAFRL